MTDYHREFRPGRLAVKFRQREFDYIGLTLDIREEKQITWMMDEEREAVSRAVRGNRRRCLPMYVSSVFDPFPDLLAWLEAVASGVRSCNFSWDAEGPHGILGFDGDRTGTGRLTATWSGRNGFEVEVQVDRRQLVAAFYQSFRRFVRSERYDPLGFEEEVRYGDALARMNAEGLSEEEIVGHVVMLERRDAERWLNGIRRGPSRFVNQSIEDLFPTLEASPPQTVEEAEDLFREGAQPEASRPKAPRKPRIAELPKRIGWAVLGRDRIARDSEDTGEWGYTHPFWDRMNTARRREDIRESFRISCGAWHGSNLRELRSETVERWLGWTAPGDSSPR